MTDLSPLHRLAQPRPVRSPRGTQLSCANWQIEAAFRMIQNNLDPEVAENPDALVVYGGIGKAARNWDCFEAILASLKKLKEDETLLVQSGKPVGVFRTHADAPRVLIANSNLVPKWATWEHFDELDRKGLMMFGQMTAGSWIYIGSQGIVQGTYETFVEAGRQHYGGSLAGPLDPDRRARRHGRRAAAGRHLRRRRLAHHRVPAEPDRLSPALALPRRAGDATSTTRWRGSRSTRAEKRAVSIGLLGNAAEVLPELVRRGVRPDLVTDQTSAHDLVNGYLPPGWTRRALARGAGRPGAARRPAPGGRRRLRDARAGDARLPGSRRADGRLRQQHPPGRVRRRREERVRLPRLRAGLHPAAVLPRQGAVPLGRAVRRPGRHPQDRREDEGALPARTRTCTAGSTWPASASPSRACRRASAGSASASGIAPGLAFNEMVKSGELKAPIVIGRDHLDAGSVASPNRETEAMKRRLRRGLRLAAAQRPAQHRRRRDLGVAAPRRRRRHGLLAARRRRDRLRRQRCGGEADRARALERPGDRRDAPCRRRLRGRDRAARASRA